MKVRERWTILFFLLLCTTQLVAQEREISIPADTIKTLQKIISDDNTLLSPEPQIDLSGYNDLPVYKAPSTGLNLLNKENKGFQFNKDHIHITPFEDSKLPISRGEFSTSGVMKQFDKGSIIGFGGQNNLTSLGTFNYASIGYYHNFNDRLSLNVNLNATKFSSYRFRNQSVGASGLLIYQLHDNITIGAFGSYSKAFPQANFANYGGYMGFDITERFGTKLGVQRYYNPVLNKWETAPIVAPYYKFKNVTLEMDFGPIIQETIRSIIGVKTMPANPTIGPPR